MDVQALCNTLAKVEVETLIYPLTDRLPVVKVPVKVECKAVLNKLVERKTEIHVHTLGDTLSEVKRYTY